MFNGDYSFRGKHASMVLELTAKFDTNDNKLFTRNLDVYLIAPIVGFIYRRKAEIDPTGKTTNILYAAMSKETKTLWFYYRLIMLLDKNYEPDFDKRINKAFRFYNSQKAKHDEELYESYVRGGVEFLHEKLMNNVTVPEDYLKNLYSFIEDFEIIYSQNTNDKINLVKLAKD